MRNRVSFVAGMICAVLLFISCGMAVNNQNVPSQVLDTKNGVVYNIFDDGGNQIVVYTYNGMTCSTSFSLRSVTVASTTSTSCVALGK